VTGLRFLAVACALAVAAPAAAQEGPSVMIVDIEAALRESAVADALREIELEERRALQARFDADKGRLEAREAELSEIRADADKADFDRLVEEFDADVRETRRAAQEDAAALQARFAAAQRALLDVVRPAAAELMRERGAVVLIDRKTVVVFDPALDVTGDLIERIDRTAPEARALLAGAPGSAPAAAPRLRP
jgi:Skp family chaperone for outer membrane proteins